MSLREPVSFPLHLLGRHVVRRAGDRALLRHRHWLWITRDAPLVAIGGPHVVERHHQEPADHRRILAMIFDNCWRTNFVADSHGTMEFQFEVVWSERLDQPSELAEALTIDPIVRRQG